MAMDPEVLYRGLGQLIADMPRDLAGPAPVSAETHRWLGRASVLVDETYGDDVGGLVEKAGFTSAVDHLHGLLQEGNAHQIVTILYRALAHAERSAPAAAQGAFLPVGAEFSVLQVVGKILGSAKKEAFIVDAYMGMNILTDFAPLAPEGVAIRLLADSFSTKTDTLKPGVTRWAKEHGAKRPLEFRITAPRLLHDRLIVIDGTEVWALSQSLQHFVARSPGTVLRVVDDIAVAKIHAYGEFWANAKAL